MVEVVDYFEHTFGRLREVMAAPDGRVFIFTSNQEIFRKNRPEITAVDDDKLIMLKNPSYRVPSAPGSIPKFREEREL